MVNLFKNFNVNFFKSQNGITWFDKEGIYDINENLYVSIEIDDVGTQNIFNGYHIRIFSRANGLLKTKFFRFQNHFKIRHVWFENGNFNWYTVVNNNRVEPPTDLEIKKFVSEIIFNYISKIT